MALGEPLNLAPAAVIALDQALATQDAVVRARTLTGLDRLRRAGTTVLLASNEDRLLETLCDEVWWLEAGELAAKGDPKETLAKYGRHVAETDPELGRNHSTAPRAVLPARRRPGGGDLDGNAGQRGKPTIVWKSGEMVSVRAKVRYHEAVEDPVLGLLIRTQIGFEVYGTNTELERVKIGPRAAGRNRDGDVFVSVRSVPQRLHADAGVARSRRHGARLAGRRHRVYGDG